ncbi:MAG: transglutaminase-like domain-containing protein, partial [Candidatus Omnitrophota bacterium]|nr:transglutaminase-like domain-containing protein [Candidatus Omnitrophota bacterium]
KGFRYLSPLEGVIIKDKKYGNDMLYIHSPSDKYSELEITVEFTVLRKEYDYYRYASQDETNISGFLKPDRIVFVDKDTRKLAADIVKDKKTEVEKAKAIYDYIIDEFTYTKDDPRVCKIGNSRLSLVFKKGQCSEYHSAFISLMRSLKIPVKFEVGFSVPADKEKGVIGGYHCWAKFYTQDKGWFPVDISEADKYPEKKDYFFGRINENRVHLTTGRDVTLPYARDKEAMPLNYFIYPYVEIDGQEFFDAKTEVSFVNK